MSDGIVKQSLSDPVKVVLLVFFRGTVLSIELKGDFDGTGLIFIVTEILESIFEPKLLYIQRHEVVGYAPGFYIGFSKKAHDLFQ